MRESHGLGSVEPSYVGVVSCALTETCRRGGASVVGGVGGSGVRGTQFSRASGQEAGCFSNDAWNYGAAAGFVGSRLAKSLVGG